MRPAALPIVVISFTRDHLDQWGSIRLEECTRTIFETLNPASRGPEPLRIELNLGPVAARPLNGWPERFVCPVRPVLSALRQALIGREAVLQVKSPDPGVSSSWAAVWNAGPRA